jgi:uncharacterized membrane protein
MIENKIIFKSIIWELIGLVTILLITSNYKVSILYVMIRIVMYYFFELVWRKYEKSNNYSRRVYRSI